jgi:hypothetical protein
VLHRHDNLSVARSIYRACAKRHRGRLVMLCDRAAHWRASAGNVHLRYPQH